MSHRFVHMALAASLLALPLPLLAQPVVQSVPAPATDQNDPYQAALSAIIANVDEKVLIDNFIKAIAAQLPKSDARIAAYEAERPGFSLAIAEGLRPQFQPYTRRVVGTFRAKYLALLREVFTPDEARALHIIFSSPVMKKFTRLIVENTNSANMIRESMSGRRQVTRSALEADRDAAISAALEQLTPADNAAMAKLPMTPELMRKMALVTERAVPLRLEMENAPMLPEEEAAVREAVEQAMIKFLASEK